MMNSAQCADRLAIGADGLSAANDNKATARRAAWAVRLDCRRGFSLHLRFFLSLLLAKQEKNVGNLKSR
jgi:hypothetical protein